MTAASPVHKNPRQLAVACMGEVARNGLLVPEAMARLPQDLAEDDLRFAYELVYGTFRYLPGLERILARYCKKAPPPIRWLLLSSLYQICHLRVPAYAVVDEANKLAAKSRYSGLKGLVNGVLRKVLREGAGDPGAMTEAEWLLPDWLAALLAEQYGAEELASWLVSWQNRPLLSYWSLRDEVLPGDTVSEYLPHARLGSKPIPSEVMQKKAIYVQNESSQALAEMALRLHPRSALDTCAAPGGKACYMAAFGTLDHLLALDPDPRRQALLEANKQRLGLGFDTGTDLASSIHPDGGYDLVLVDAPCSGIGIVGRHPEIKHLKRGPADQRLRDIQRTILEQAWSYTRLGGYLLYAVCSLDRNELPPLPLGARPLTGDLAEDFFRGIPCVRRQGDFYFPPSERFDGFSAMLLVKTY